MAVPQDRKGSDPRSYLRKTLYRHRYLVLGVVLAADAGQIAFGYSTASSRIDVSGGGVWVDAGDDLHDQAGGVAAIVRWASEHGGCPYFRPRGDHARSTA